MSKNKIITKLKKRYLQLKKISYNLIMVGWKTKNRRKFLLQYHIILVCKYRKKLLSHKEISDDIKELSSVICSKHKINIKCMETDKDHIHYMIEVDTDINISRVVNIIKSYTTYHIWKKHYNYLKKHFWKEKTFFTDGYFVSTIGNVNEEKLHEYIKNQG